MLSVAHQPSPKITAMIAAADTNCTAVAIREHSAAFVSFQRYAPSVPPTQNVHSVAFSLNLAAQFSGHNAIYAVIATTTATFD